MFAFANFGTPHQQQREYNQSDRRDHSAEPISGVHIQNKNTRLELNEKSQKKLNEYRKSSSAPLQAIKRDNELT